MEQAALETANLLREPATNGTHVTVPDSPNGNHKTEDEIKQKRSGYRQYLRDVILGVNDGLVSVFLLMVTVEGGNASPSTLLLAGIGGALAGAISMGLSEYVATKSQGALYKRVVEEARAKLAMNKDFFTDAIRRHLESVGVSYQLIDRIVSDIKRQDATVLHFMRAFEWGQVEQEERNPILASLFSSILFLVGAIPAVIPFTLHVERQTAFYIACAGCGSCLFIIGILKTLAISQYWLYGAIENSLIGAGAAAISWAVGYAYFLLT